MRNYKVCHLLDVCLSDFSFRNTAKCNYFLSVSINGNKINVPLEKNEHTRLIFNKIFESKMLDFRPFWS